MKKSSFLVILLTIFQFAGCKNEEFRSEDARGFAATALLVMALYPARSPSCTSANLITLTSAPQYVKFASDSMGFSWGFAGASIASGQTIVITSTTTNLTPFEAPNTLYAYNGTDCNATLASTVLNCTGTTLAANCQVYATSSLATLAPTGSYRFHFSGNYPDLQMNK